MTYSRRIVHYSPTPTEVRSVISDRVVEGCWFELHRQGGCGAGELKLKDDFLNRHHIEIGDWIGLEYQENNRWYLGRVEQREAKSPAGVRLRLEGMGIELNEVFPGGFHPEQGDKIPPHRYACTDLFPHDPDREIESVDVVTNVSELVKKLLTQYVLPRSYMTFQHSDIDLASNENVLTSLKFRGEESVRSILKELAVRTGNASWGVDASGRFFFRKPTETVSVVWQEGVHLTLLEENRDREHLYNRLLLTGGYIYDEPFHSERPGRGFYRWRGNYVHPESRTRNGERRIRLAVPWIRSRNDARTFAEEFFRMYAHPQSQYRIEVADQTELVKPWEGKIQLRDRNHLEIVTAFAETIRVEFDRTPIFHIELGIEDPHSLWAEPPENERWEIPADPVTGWGGDSIHFSSSDFSSWRSSGESGFSSQWYSSSNDESETDWDTPSSSGSVGSDHSSNPSEFTSQENSQSESQLESHSSSDGNVTSNAGGNSSAGFDSNGSDPSSTTAGSSGGSLSGNSSETAEQSSAQQGDSSEVSATSTLGSPSGMV